MLPLSSRFPAIASFGGLDPENRPVMTRSGSSVLPLGLLPAVVLVLSGCSGDRSPVVIATPWDREACRQFADLLSEAPGDPLPPIRWVRLDPWDDPAHLLEAGRPVHLLLGWPAATLADLHHRGFLDPSGGDPFFAELGGAPAPPAVSEAISPLTLPRPEGKLVQGDPRIDPTARDQLASILLRDGIRDAYATLTLSASSPLESAGDPDAQGFSVAAIDARSLPEAQTLLDRLRRQVPTEPLGSDQDSPLTPAVRTLAAELIGATILDAEPELRRARASLEQSPDAASLGGTLLSEPPPWPPDSIRRLGDDPGRQSMLATLAAALVDDPQSREWLLDSWQRPPRPVDRALFESLATANDGRVFRSSRVLPWLRAEWTAWARQRYAQVARELGPETGIEEAAR
jgi:hypothetical protein